MKQRQKFVYFSLSLCPHEIFWKLLFSINFTLHNMDLKNEVLRKKKNLLGRETGIKKKKIKFEFDKKLYVIL